MIGAIIAAAVAVILQVIVVLLVMESYLLATGREPITWYVRRLEGTFPGPAIFAAVAMAFVVGALFAHFVWDQLKDEKARPNDPD